MDTEGQVPALLVRVEHLERRMESVRDVAEVAAASKADAILRGFMMSYPDHGESIAELRRDIHGPHGVDRRIEETRICVFGAQNDNGLRGTIRFQKWVLRVHWAIMSVWMADHLGIISLPGVTP